MTLTGPDGWPVKATTPSSFATVAPGQTARTTWSAAVPPDAKPGSYGFLAQATFTDANGGDSTSDVSTVSVPYQSLTAAYDRGRFRDDLSQSVIGAAGRRATNPRRSRDTRMIIATHLAGD